MSPSRSSVTRGSESPLLLDVIAHPVRRELLRLVWGEERSAGDIAARFDVTFGAVSQHLRVMRDAGLVSVRKEGRRRYYRADRDALGPFASALEAFWGERLARVKALAEQRQRKKRSRP